MLRMGQVVVTEMNRHNVLSRAIARATRSVVTHSFMALGAEYGIEAVFPRVRVINTTEKLSHLRDNDQAYAILEVPGSTLGQRYNAVLKALSYEGRFYDVGQLLLYALTHKFWNDGSGTLLCSRLITASYLEGAAISLFPDELLASKYGETHPRIANLRAGYATPADLLLSKLDVVDFVPSSHSPTLAAFLPRESAR